jgi:ectoine hydroxylase-related dioxygenase (phytanoyl-CoA dioxygenase family)
MKIVFEIQDLIDDDSIDLVNGEIDNAVNAGYQGYEKLSSQRLEGLHECYPNIRRLWLDVRHRRLVNLIFGVNTRSSQSLTFVYGLQQSAHSDLVYLTTYTARYMCGMWVALQTFEEGSGELVVYPGSHRDQRIYFKDTGVERVKGGSNKFDKVIYSKWAQIASKYKPLVYRPKKGSKLIWHENLLHGGSIRANNNLEGRSMVKHYFAVGVCVYYDHSGLVGHVAPLEMVKCNVVL